VGVGLGGAAGLVMSWHAFGGPVAQAGFATLALAWWGTGWMAWREVRAGRIAEHRRWMIRNFALSFAAVTLRLYLPPVFILGLSFEFWYAVIAWISWVPNLVLAQWLTRQMPASMPARG
jgi:hypothetical protein